MTKSNKYGVACMYARYIKYFNVSSVIAKYIKIFK